MTERLVRRGGRAGQHEAADTMTPSASPADRVGYAPYRPDEIAIITVWPSAIATAANIALRSATTRSRPRPAEKIAAASAACASAFEGGRTKLADGRQTNDRAARRARVVRAAGDECGRDRQHDRRVRGRAASENAIPQLLIVRRGLGIRATRAPSTSRSTWVRERRDRPGADRDIASCTTSATWRSMPGISIVHAIGGPGEGDPGRRVRGRACR